MESIKGKSLLALSKSPDTNLKAMYKANIDAIVSGQIKVSLAGLDDKGVNAVKSLFNGKFSDGFIAVMRGKSGQSGEHAKAMGAKALALYTQMETLCDQYITEAKKSADYKAGGFGDIVLYIRGK